MAFKFVLFATLAAVASADYSERLKYATHQQQPQAVYVQHEQPAVVKQEISYQPPQISYKAAAPAPVATYQYQSEPQVSYKAAPQIVSYKSVEPQHVQYQPVQVLSKAPAYSSKHEDEYHNAPAHYQFSYSVHDEHTGDIKSQEETREGDVVKGYYTLVDADGHRRIVEYQANDHDGFTAQVRREEVKGYQAPAPQQVKYVAAPAPVPKYHQAAPSPIIYQHEQPAQQPQLIKYTTSNHGEPAASLNQYKAYNSQYNH